MTLRLTIIRARAERRAREFNKIYQCLPRSFPTTYPKPGAHSSPRRDLTANIVANDLAGNDEASVACLYGYFAPSAIPHSLPVYLSAPLVRSPASNLPPLFKYNFVVY